MAVYLVAYNLAKADQTKNLWEALTALGAKHIQDSVWAVRSNFTAAQLQKHLWPYVGLQGRLLVADTQDWASWNPLSDINSV
jgi:hypothetical protein